MDAGRVRGSKVIAKPGVTAGGYEIEKIGAVVQGGVVRNGIVEATLAHGYAGKLISDSRDVADHVTLRPGAGYGEPVAVAGEHAILNDIARGAPDVDAPVAVAGGDVGNQEIPPGLPECDAGGVLDEQVRYQRGSVGGLELNTRLAIADGIPAQNVLIALHPDAGGDRVCRARVGDGHAADFGLLEKRLDADHEATHRPSLDVNSTGQAARAERNQNPHGSAPLDGVAVEIQANVAGADLNCRRRAARQVRVQNVVASGDGQVVAALDGLLS